ncbi:MAG: thiamine pyrophosphate-binding protein, partial [Bacteroidota bacterium]
MPSSDRAGLSLMWCFHLVDALWRHGVREAFISPGSRSTPLALALVHHHGIRCHSVLDERAAAFMALGAGKERMRAASATPPGSPPVFPPAPAPAPALFVCTSGTAVANAFPAVVEARMSGT